MGNLEDMTERQRAAWPEAVAEINRYHVEASENPDHYDWTFKWFEESRPGRGRMFDALFINGEHFAQVMMDVYGTPTVSVCALDIMHNGSDEECPCEFCKAERDEEDARWETITEEFAPHQAHPLTVTKTKGDIELITHPDLSTYKGLPKEEMEDQMFNTRPIEADYAVAPGEWLREWMQENGVSAVTLAHFLNWEMRWLKRFLKGKQPVDAVIAQDLAMVTKIPAKSWLAFQEQYDKDRTRLIPTWRRVLADLFGIKRDGMSR